MKWAPITLLLLWLAACGDPSDPERAATCEEGLEECYLDVWNATSWLTQGSYAVRCREWFKGCADVERVPPHRQYCAKVEVVFTSSVSD